MSQIELLYVRVAQVDLAAESVEHIGRFHQARYVGFTNLGKHMKFVKIIELHYVRQLSDIRIGNCLCSSIGI